MCSPGLVLARLLFFLLLYPLLLFLLLLLLQPSLQFQTSLSAWMAPLTLHISFTFTYASFMVSQILHTLYNISNWTHRCAAS